MTYKGWETYVPVVKDRHGATFIADPITKKRHKYGALKTTVDGITFSSKKEAERYQALRLLERAGVIVGLELQPRFKLHVIGEGFSVQIGEYVADFRYVTGREGVVVEDVKGMKTPIYRWKKKHVEAEYGITILET